MPGLSRDRSVPMSAPGLASCEAIQAAAI